MFGIGETEFVLILLFAFMIFGPDKLPGMGRTLGRALRQFRTAQEGFTKVVQTEVLDPAAEIMNADPLSPNRKRSEEADAEDLDADLSDDDEVVQKTRKTETFAERKARLARERAEAEAALEKEAHEAKDEPLAEEPESDEEKEADTADSDADAPAQSTQKKAPRAVSAKARAIKVAKTSEPKAKTKASDLYGSGSKGTSSRKKAAKQKAAQEKTAAKEAKKTTASKEKKAASKGEKATNKEQVASKKKSSTKAVKSKKSGKEDKATKKAL